MNTSIATLQAKWTDNPSVETNQALYLNLDSSGRHLLVFPTSPDTEGDMEMTHDFQFGIAETGNFVEFIHYSIQEDRAAFEKRRKDFYEILQRKYTSLLAAQSFRVEGKEFEYVDLLFWKNSGAAKKHGKEIEQADFFAEFGKSMNQMFAFQRMVPAHRKLELSKSDTLYFNAMAQPLEVELPDTTYLCISGKGHPSNSNFNQAIESLMSCAFGLKFLYKESGIEYVVPKLEATWWVESDQPFMEVPKEEWMWKLQIRVPVVPSEETLKAILQKEKHGFQINLEARKAGKFVQIMHTGSYEAEDQSIQKIFEYAEKEGSSIVGKHQEIYISDPRRTAEDKLKTVLKYEVN